MTPFVQRTFNGGKTDVVATGVDCATHFVKDLPQRQFFRITLRAALLENKCKKLPFFSERELKFMFAICHRPSVCRLSSVTLVHPTQAIEICGDVSTPFGTLAIC